MPKKLLKSHRYAMRLEPGMFHRMQTIAVALGAPLPEIICVAVLRLLATTTTAEQYSAVKVQTFLGDQEGAPSAPPSAAP